MPLRGEILKQTCGFATPEIAKAWASEIDRRLDAYDRGETSAVDFNEALGRIHHRLVKHRGRGEMLPC